jgi:hypothetical protein
MKWVVIRIHGLVGWGEWLELGRSHRCMVGGGMGVVVGVGLLGIYWKESLVYGWWWDGSFWWLLELACWIGVWLVGWEWLLAVGVGLLGIY